MLLAVDLGVSGSISVFKKDGSVELLEMPVDKIETGKKTKKGNPATRKRL